DASASMKGNKLETCKKAGIALAYKAIDKKDKVGLVVFGSEIKSFIDPTDNFTELIKEIVKITASQQTDIPKTIEKSLEIFPRKNITKHLILITDALPTTGKDPEKETLQSSSIARESGITISLIGIQLDNKGEELAKKIVEIGDGKMYIAQNLEQVDSLILEDYENYS
ncbi:MAG: VWA domain-containing protein, partial [Asgard group archaeon]|nr:VWA domain-containing protein [Asgard group archaeon]